MVVVMLTQVQTLTATLMLTRYLAEHNLAKPVRDFDSIASHRNQSTAPRRGPVRRYDRAADAVSVPLVGKEHAGDRHRRELWRLRSPVHGSVDVFDVIEHDHGALPAELHVNTRRAAGSSSHDFLRFPNTQRRKDSARQCTQSFRRRTKAVLSCFYVGV